MRKAPKPRKQAFTPEILDLFRRAHAMWMGVIDESRTNDIGAQGQILGPPIPCPKVR